MKTPDALKVAAALLREDATAEQESCAVGDKQWACADCVKDADGKCQPMRNVEVRVRTAATLEMIAEAM